MPELPEVESTCKGIRQSLLNKNIINIIIRQAKLRWPIDFKLQKTLIGLTIESVERRAKYIFINTNSGSLIIHLGMSGKLSITHHSMEILKHDHFDCQLNDGTILRYTDPRRFGCILWTQNSPFEHRLIKHLGLEPLDAQCNANYLFKKTRGVKRYIKETIMDQKLMVGVGNIYATEALYLSAIKPNRSSQDLSLANCQLLMKAIKNVLKYAIKRGGTTLRDFLSPDGQKGYFSLELKCYGKKNLNCNKCDTPFKNVKIAQRTSIYCPSCQT